MKYPCECIGIQKLCCCCCSCPSRRVYFLLSLGCIMLSMLNMISYPICLPTAISSMVLGFYYFVCGLVVLLALFRDWYKVFQSFPLVMVLSYLPLAAYVACIVNDVSCVRRKAPIIAQKNSTLSTADGVCMFATSLYIITAVIDFLFSLYATLLGIGHAKNMAKGST